MVLFIIQWIIVSTSVRYVTENHLLFRLKNDTENLLFALHFPNAGGTPSLDTSRMDPIYQRPFSGHYFILQVQNSVLRSRSLWDQDLPLPKTKVGETRTLRTLGPQRQSLFLLISGFKK